MKKVALSLLVFEVVVAVLMMGRISVEMSSLRQEVKDLKQTVTTSRDSILVNVKKPVWWR